MFLLWPVSSYQHDIIECDIGKIYMQNPGVLVSKDKLAPVCLLGRGEAEQRKEERDAGERETGWMEE